MPDLNDDQVSDCDQSSLQEFIITKLYHTKNPALCTVAVATRR